jgi:phage-related minor tail protein
MGLDFDIGDLLKDFGKLITRAFDTFEDWIKDTWASALSEINKGFDFVKNGINDMAGPLDEIGNFIENLPNFIRDELTSGLNILGDKFTEVGNDIKRDIMEEVNIVHDGLNDFGNKAMGSINELGDSLEDTFTGIGNTLFNGIEGISDQVKGTFEGVIDTVITTFVKLGDDMKNVFEGVFEKFIEVIYWLWECIQYIINCFTCIAFFVQRIFSLCIFSYIFRLIILIIWGIILAFLYIIQQSQWAENVVSFIYDANDFIDRNSTIIYPDGINIIKFVYPDSCYDCGFSFSAFPAPPSF